MTSWQAVTGSDTVVYVRTHTRPALSTEVRQAGKVLGRVETTFGPDGRPATSRLTVLFSSRSRRASSLVSSMAGPPCVRCGVWLGVAVQLRRGVGETQGSGVRLLRCSQRQDGGTGSEQSRAREKKIVRWLDSVKHDAAAILLLGDIFDFWFEYSTVVPKGYVRIFGKLAELTDAGIRIHFFVGNHDMWMFDYLEEELNIPVYRTPQIFIINNKRFLVGHGDGLGPGDKFYKILKKIFRKENK